MEHVYKIKSEVLRLEGHRCEGVDKRYIAGRLKEIKKRDPQATMLAIPVQR